MVFKLFIFLVCFGLYSCGSKSLTTTVPGAGQTDIERFAEEADIHYEILGDSEVKGCGPLNSSPCSHSRIILSYPYTFKNNKWAIYFHHQNTIFKSENSGFRVEHVNGDLHRLTPTESFDGFVGGEAIAVEIYYSGKVLSEYKVMPNYYISSKGGKTKNIKSTQVIFDEDSGLELRPYLIDPKKDDSIFRKNKLDKTKPATTAYLFDKNKYFSSHVPEGYAHVENNHYENVRSHLIPTPDKTVYDQNGKIINLKNGIFVLKNEFENEFHSAFEHLETLGINRYGDSNDQRMPISILRSSSMDSSEAYSLKITEKIIKIRANGEAGVFYALQSLAGLTEAGKAFVPAVEIIDSPAYEYRGMHIDVARQFRSKEFIYSLIRQMSYYKLNTLHLHLADDEGWRLEIPGLPELTNLGGFRCHDPEENFCLLPQLGSGGERDSKVNGFYSVKDYIDIVRVANAHHIQVIPSLDLPGHARAAVKSMEKRYRDFLKRGDNVGAKEYLLTDFSDETVYQSIQAFNDNTINVCLESSYNFVEKIVDEVIQLHSKAGQPLTHYHIGADETAGAWLQSSICKDFVKNNQSVDTLEHLGAYFIERVAKILYDRNVVTAAWNDGLDHVGPDNLPDTVFSYVWRPLPRKGTHVTHRQLNQGWKVILALPDALYFDFPYEADMKEPGLTWASRHTNTKKIFDFMPDNLPIHAEIWLGEVDQTFKLNDAVEQLGSSNFDSNTINDSKRVYGIQGNLWGELIRSDLQADYAIYPRLLALAERAWHKPSWAPEYNAEGGIYSPETNHFKVHNVSGNLSDWRRFSNTLSKRELPKLDLYSIHYRLPVPGALVNKGILTCNSIFPSLDIEFSTNGEEWKKCVSKHAVGGSDVFVRSRSPSGKRTSRVIQVESSEEEYE